MSRRAWLLLLAVGALWGCSYVLIKVALHDYSEAAIVCLRSGLGGLPLLAVAAWNNELPALRGRLRWLLVVALVQLAGPYLLINYGENYIASSLTGILLSTVPILTALIALGVDTEERSVGWGLVGLMVGLVGVVLLFGVDLSGSARELLGGGMILVAALGYAISWFIVKHRLAGAPSTGVAGATLLLATLMTAPLLAVETPIQDIHADSLAAILGLSIGSTGVALLLYYLLLREVGPRRAAIVTYLSPVFSVIFGVLLLDESLSAVAIGGLVLIIAGTWLGVEGRVRRAARRGASPEASPGRSSA